MGRRVVLKTGSARFIGFQGSAAVLSWPEATLPIEVKLVKGRVSK